MRTSVLTTLRGHSVSRKVKTVMNVNIVFRKPCITDGRNRQMWWPSEPALPDRRNTSFRKEKYKFFWTMLFHRGVFLDERYRERKLNVLQLDPRFTNVASHRRDILPECVVNLVRVWFPNPKNIPYMGHRWQ